ncbi:hypothetical protein TNCT_192561 [Trichonephila clavata]|uniref:Uncharacterized protein n=1 Tax=Trichonephila clavata TaxID=2740835 RepID=A0A8X6JK59_TRICU|nr:hypothetical protein TNCT_192561 [Trichonephila clavata]
MEWREKWVDESGEFGGVEWRAKNGSGVERRDRSRVGEREDWSADWIVEQSEVELREEKIGEWSADWIGEQSGVRRRERSEVEKSGQDKENHMDDKEVGERTRAE